MSYSQPSFCAPSPNLLTIFDFGLFPSFEFLSPKITSIPLFRYGINFFLDIWTRVFPWSLLDITWSHFALKFILLVLYLTSPLDLLNFFYVCHLQSKHFRIFDWKCANPTHFSLLTPKIAMFKFSISLYTNSSLLCSYFSCSMRPLYMLNSFGLHNHSHQQLKVHLAFIQWHLEELCYLLLSALSP